MSDAFQQLVQIEYRAEFARDLGEHRKCLRLPRDTRVQPGILDGHGNSRRRQFEQAKLLLLEVADLLAFDVDDADDAALDDERHSQLGAHRRICRDVVLLVPHIVDQNRLFTRSSFADDAFADAEAPALRLRRVADLEAHPQVIGAIIQQQDGEDAEVHDRADQLRRLMHEGLQIERGVERIRQPHEERELDRFDAHACARRAALAGWGGSLLQSRPKACRGADPAGRHPSQISLHCLRPGRGGQSSHYSAATSGNVAATAPSVAQMGAVCAVAVSAAFSASTMGTLALAPMRVAPGF